MKTIQLTKGLVALVDDEDFEVLNQWKWKAHVYKDGTAYAERNEWRCGQQKMILMHRQILGMTGKTKVDHRDRNGLNNQRENLRRATNSQSSANTKRHSDAGSRFKGVTWDKARSKWMARITIGKRFNNLGRFNSESEAAAMYDLAAVLAFGEFALTNRDLGLL